MNNQNAPAPSLAYFPSVGWREPERSEGAECHRWKSGPDRMGHPDPEVVAQASERRRFTADYEQHILAHADQARGSGGVGAPRLVLFAVDSVATDRNSQASTPQKREP